MEGWIKIFLGLLFLFPVCFVCVLIELNFVNGKPGYRESTGNLGSILFRPVGSGGLVGAVLAPQ